MCGHGLVRERYFTPRLRIADAAHAYARAYVHRSPGTSFQQQAGVTFECLLTVKPVSAQVRTVWSGKLVNEKKILEALEPAPAWRGDFALTPSFQQRAKTATTAALR
jgi:hypothetical protein